jgi:hypothetical protein
MAVPPVPMQCPACGMEWKVSPRPDGSMPITSRCPKARGGCGKLRKVPRAARAAVVTLWDPPSGLRQPGQAAEPCPDCGGPVKIDPRGITRWCPGCPVIVTPPRVLAPYERGTEITRAAKSQHERDLEALDLAGRKGIMLTQLRGLADDDRLDPAALPKVEWFAEQVKAAAGAGRLDELAVLFGEEGIKLRGWFRRPVSITTGYDDEEDEHYDEEDDEPAAMLAIPAAVTGQQRAPVRATWADAFAAYGWRLAPPDHSLICPVITSEGRCHEPSGGHPPVTDGIVHDGWPCDPHYGALGAACISINQRRGIT